MSVKVINPSSTWFFSIIYASNSFADRKILWDQLVDFANTIKDSNDDSWLISGDFNEILKAYEKFGGNNIVIIEPPIFGSVSICVTL